jgi:arginase
VIGARDVDATERQNILDSGLTVFTMRDIDEKGMKSVVEQAIKIVSARTAGFHVSMDLDFFDPFYAPGVGTPVKGGGTYREGHLAMELIAESGKMVSLDLVEVNPILDKRNKTAALAVELAVSALGKNII